MCVKWILDHILWESSIYTKNCGTLSVHQIIYRSQFTHLCWQQCLVVQFVAVIFDEADGRPQPGVARIFNVIPRCYRMFLSIWGQLLKLYIPWLTDSTLMPAIAFRPRAGFCKSLLGHFHHRKTQTSDTKNTFLPIGCHEANWERRVFGGLGIVAEGGHLDWQWPCVRNGHLSMSMCVIVCICVCVRG